MEYWHTLEIPDISAKYATDPEQGLTESQVSSRLKEYGTNELKEKRSRSIFAMFFAQFADFMVIILIVAAVISRLFG